MIYKTQELSGMMLDRACAMFDPFVDELRWEFKDDHFVGFAAPDQDGDEEIVMVICDSVGIQPAVRILAGYKLYAASAQYSPSTNWAQGGRILERTEFRINSNASGSDALIFDVIGGGAGYSPGQRPLISAMRAYVGSKTGETIELDGAA